MQIPLFWKAKPVVHYLTPRASHWSLSSCEPWLAQHHRLLLSIPPVFFCPFVIFPAFSKTPRTEWRARRCPEFYTHFYSRTDSIFFLFASCIHRRAASAAREKHPSTTARRQAANTATPILTPAVPLRCPRPAFAIFFYVCQLACVREPAPRPFFPTAASLASSRRGWYQQGLGCWGPPSAPLQAAHLDRAPARWAGVFLSPFARTHVLMWPLPSFATLLWHVEICSDVVKHVDDGGDACVIGGDGDWGGRLACMSPSKQNRPASHCTGDSVGICG